MTAPFRRRVLYIPGYDPFPARRYRELYRTEGARQAALSGHVIAVAGAGPDAWDVTARVEGQDVAARIAVLGWSDIVQASMGRHLGSPWLDLGRVVRAYVLTGAFFRLMRLRPGPVLAGLYPALGLIGQGLVALAAGTLAWRLGAVLHPAAGGALAAAAALAVLEGFRRIDGRIFVHYLLHDFAFAVSDGGAYPAAVEARLADWRGQVAAALEDRPDEVLVVGHSSGAHLAVSLVADLVRSGAPQGAVLSLLTLGQAIPMVSVLPRAGRLRGDLALLAAQDGVPWVDVSAPGDGCSFALCDAPAVTGVAPPGARWPLVLSAAFSRTLSPQARGAMRWRFFRRHFQYLCAFDRLPPGDPAAYDYFAVTAGPRTLWQRFGARRPSPGRITRAVSRHRDVAP
ncbi:MAG: hypothetical protein MUF73_19495 [Rhodobacteraceae bacterium]|jgi:hypothetical protein|nr:hypothetical protein [Paracoccaceae bacterium]